MVAVARDYKHGGDGVASVTDLRTERVRVLSGTLNLRREPTGIVLETEGEIPRPFM